MVAFNKQEPKKLEDPWEGAEVVFAYTRAQAIADGVLVDLSKGAEGTLCKELGFKPPIAITSAAFAATAGKAAPGEGVRGKLWDVLYMMRMAAKSAGDKTDRVYFSVRVWDGEKNELVHLWALCGPGDTPDPVLTIMLQGED